MGNILKRFRRVIRIVLKAWLRPSVPKRVGLKGPRLIPLPPRTPMNYHSNRTSQWGHVNLPTPLYQPCNSSPHLPAAPQLLFGRTGPKHDPMMNNNRGACSLLGHRYLHENYSESWPGQDLQPGHECRHCVNQIERFYVRSLPLSREMAKSLQSFREE